ncbi:hypothetical protein SAMN02745687_01226 [Lachnospiraceae bacterium NK3A20]|nr:hypothetical protein SAMN02745687_01226 [Lachnospiraceae bacterium NK3A20]
MSKMSELSMLLDSLIECGEKLTETAKGLKAFYTDTGEPEPKQPEIPKKAAAPKPEPEKKPALKKEDVRLLLSKKASEDEGRYKVQVKNLVRKYANGGSLTDIPPEKYEELLRELEVIGDA